MAETPSTQEELHLRRRARRRLVGAVALALLAVVVLPMVFDPEPRPLGDKVEIRIPEQNTPFNPAPAATPATPEPPAVSEPVVAPAPAVEPEKTEPVPAQPAPRIEAKPEAKAAPAAKAETKAKPEAKVEAKAKPEAKPKPEAKTPETKPAAKPAATGAYFLQLGVFSSQANAEQMIAKAKAAGFKASTVASGSQFKVRVGPVAERGKALDYQTKLKSRGLDNVLVEP